MSSLSAADEDHVDRMRREWANTYPDIDTEPIEVMARITKIGTSALHQLDRALAPRGVTRSEFDVLCVLARSDRPLRTSEVTAVTMLSGASTTKQVDQLVRQGLVQRRAFERDARVVLLDLTDIGRALVVEEFPQRVSREARFLDGLGDDERQTLATLLRRISVNVEAGERR